MTCDPVNRDVIIEVDCGHIYTTTKNNDFFAFAPFVYMETVETMTKTLRNKNGLQNGKHKLLKTIGVYMYTPKMKTNFY